MTSIRRSATLLSLTVAAGALAGCDTTASSDEVGRWRLAAPMLEPRAHHGMVVLATGEVLVMGGISGWAEDGSAESLSSAELYDPVSGTWRATAPMGTPRSLITPVLLADGRVLVAGGATGFARMIECGQPQTDVLLTAAAELFDPATETWTPAAPLPGAQFCVGVRLPGGQALCANGWWETLSCTHGPEAVLWDPSTEVWSSAGEVPESASGHAVVLAGGEVLVVGMASPGAVAPRSVALRDPATGDWRGLPPLPHGVAWSTLTALADGRALLVGGCRTYYWGCPNVEDPREARLFDPATGTFGAVAPTLFPRFYATAALLPSGRVLVMGGNTQSTDAPMAQYLTEAGPAEVFDPATGAWRPTPAMPHFVQEAGAAVTLPSGEVLHSGGIVKLRLATENPDLVAITAAQLYRE